MSLHIDIEKVHRVLLSDGWHEVLTTTRDDHHAGTTFVVADFWLDAYEFVEVPTRAKDVHRDIRLAFNGGTGFAFLDQQTGGYIMGPVSSIIAVEPYLEGEWARLQEDD